MYTVVCVQAPRLRRISVDDRYSLVHVGLVCRKDVLDVVSSESRWTSAHNGQAMCDDPIRPRSRVSSPTTPL